MQGELLMPWLASKLTLRPSTLANTQKLSPLCLPWQHTSLWSTLTLLILMSRDIQTNPHPSTIYLSGFCELKVGWSHQAIACDECSVWYHMLCLELCSNEYNRLELEGFDCVWICNHWATPNYDTGIFRSYELELSNSYSVLFGGHPSGTLVAVSRHYVLLFWYI